VMTAADTIQMIAKSSRKRAKVGKPHILRSVHGLVQQFSELHVSDFYTFTPSAARVFSTMGSPGCSFSRSSKSRRVTSS